MPFTLAHPAAVLPLLRKGRPWLSATGLVLGSMSPDFEYFIRLRPGGGFGHSLLGLLLMDVPLSLIVAGLFYGLVRKPLVRNLPAFLRNRLSYFQQHPWPLSNLWSPRLLLGIIIGGITHILWDDLTHSRGPIARNFSPLHHDVLDRPLFLWLQYASSGFGLLMIAWFIWSLPARPTLPRPSRQRQTYFWAGAAVCFGLIWPVLTKFSQEYQSITHSTAAIVTSITAGTLALLIISIIIRFTRTGRATGEEAT